MWCWWELVESSGRGARWEVMGYMFLKAILLPHLFSHPPSWFWSAQGGQLCSTLLSPPWYACSSVTDPKATQPANQRLNPLKVSLKTNSSFCPISWCSQSFLSQKWKAKVHISLMFIFFYLLYRLRDFQIMTCVLKIMGIFFYNKVKILPLLLFLWPPVGRIITDKLLYVFVLSRWAPWSHRTLDWILDLCLPNNRTLGWILSHLQGLDWGTLWKPV